MKPYPQLNTPRLLLRQHTLADAPDVQRYAGDKSVAATTLRIPHPYEDGMAEAWIATHLEEFAQNKGVVFAIVRKTDQHFMGAIGLELELEHDRAALGYYIGKPFWNNGYVTEAAHAVLQYGFTELKLHRIHAVHFTHNPASGRIMQKIGMRHEGCLRQHIKKWNVYADEEIYGILRDEYLSNFT
jgi:RimJ/RimL family protein N-acetyltransferase